MARTAGPAATAALPRSVAPVCAAQGAPWLSEAAAAHLNLRV